MIKRSQRAAMEVCGSLPDSLFQGPLKSLIVWCKNINFAVGFHR